MVFEALPLNKTFIVIIMSSVFRRGIEVNRFGGELITNKSFGRGRDERVER